MRHESSRLPRREGHQGGGGRRAHLGRPDGRAPSAPLVRNLRHRPPRVRRRADRHPHDSAPAERFDRAADPRPRVLGGGARGRTGRAIGARRRPGLGDAAAVLRHVLLLPARPQPPLHVDGVRRTQRRVGRHRRAVRRARIEGLEAARVDVRHPGGARRADRGRRVRRGSRGRAPWRHRADHRTRPDRRARVAVRGVARSNRSSCQR